MKRPMKISLAHKLKTFTKVYFIKLHVLLFALYCVKKSYHNIPTYTLSKEYRMSHEPKNTDLIYGELSIHAFLYLLALIIKNKNEKIYDLGCGDGKLLLSAALYFKKIQAVGIEKIENLTNIAKNINKLNISKINYHSSSVTFFSESFLVKDFSDGNIIYVNGCALGKTTWDALNERFNRLNKNSYLISVENKVFSPCFTMIYKGMHAASWGKTRVYIYQKI